MTRTKLITHPDRHKHVIQGVPYTWREHDGTKAPGVGLILPPMYLIQCLTPDQAIGLANQLVDAAETITTEGNAS